MTAYIRRSFAGAAPKTTLTNGPYTSVTTSMTIASATGWPTGTNGPFVVTIDRGNATEEKILVSSLASFTFTIATRGYDGTTASTHQSGASVEITNSAIDLDEANQAVAALLGTPTTVGDMVSVSGTNPTTYQRIAAGSSGQVLQGGTPPSYTANPSITSLTTSGLVTAGGEVSATDVKATGLTGSASSVRLIGGNASGAPASGTQVARDFVVNTDGTIEVCTAGGSPGTFVNNTAAVIAAKGDLLVGTAAKAVTNVTVGADGTVLIADSTQSSGVAWSTSSQHGDFYLLRRTGAVAESFPRDLFFPFGSAPVGAAPTTQILRMTAVPVRKGQVVTNITFMSASVAANTPTNWWFVFADSGLVVRAVSADQLTAAWAASTEKTLAMASPYTVTSDQMAYIGMMMKAGTVPTIFGLAAGAPATNPLGLAPLLEGNSNTGQTTPPSTGATLTSLTATGNRMWGYIS